MFILDCPYRFINYYICCKLSTDVLTNLDALLSDIISNYLIKLTTPAAFILSCSNSCRNIIRLFGAAPWHGSNFDQLLPPTSLRFYRLRPTLMNTNFEASVIRCKLRPSLTKFNSHPCVINTKCLLFSGFYIPRVVSYIYQPLSYYSFFLS